MVNTQLSLHSAPSSAKASSSDPPTQSVDEALALGHKIKPVPLGPVTYLWLGKVKGEPFDRLTLLKDILPVYQHALAELAKRGIEVQ